jgi:hypothetical protein
VKSSMTKTAGIVAALAAASVVLSGCGSATKGSAAAAATGGAAASASTAASGDTSSYGTNAITLNVYGGVITMSGVDSAKHDAILPSSWVVKEGQTFTLTVINYDDGQHSITAPDLGLNFIVAPGKKDDATNKVTPTTSTTTFVATKTGDFHWYCAFPCDGPSHLGMTTTGNNGRGYDMIMAGEIVVVA